MGWTGTPFPNGSNRAWGKHTAGRGAASQASGPQFLGSRLLGAFFTFHMAHLFFAGLF
jgi:hypothetical protein